MSEFLRVGLYGFFGTFFFHGLFRAKWGEGLKFAVYTIVLYTIILKLFY